MTSRKIPVAILGATGMAGQRYVQLLQDHPYFEVKDLAASERSKDKSYFEAVSGRWLSADAIPDNVRDKKIIGIEEVSEEVRLIFSAVDSDLAREWEPFYARQGKFVVSNASAFRSDPLVPVLIPEINPEHLEVLASQREIKGWKGAIVTKPNCSIQSYLLPLYVLEKFGFEIESLIVSTMQALSGAGFPGLSAMSLTENVVPLIRGEEEKTELEPLKLLGSYDSRSRQIENRKDLVISAHCNRVPVLDGHMACVSVKLKNSDVDLKEIWSCWEKFEAGCSLPLSPKKAIHCHQDEDRPQPRIDRESDLGMAVHVGRLRPCNVFDFRFVGLSHNTLRGAAGGGVLIAEYLQQNNYLD